MSKKKRLPKESLVLYFSLFFMALCGISYEYTFSKISTDLLGNSAKQWAIIIGLMMFFMGIGSDMQKYISDKNILKKFITFEVLLGIIGGFGPILLLFIFGEYRDFFVTLQYGLIISVGFLIGLEIPLITRINEKYVAELKSNIGAVLQFDYIGSFAGAIIWIFILPKFFSLIETAFILGITNIIVAFWTYFFFRKSDKIKIYVPIFIIFCFSAVIYGFTNAAKWTYSAEQKLYADKVILSKTTKYQHIILTKTTSNDIYCYINANLQFSSVDEAIYHEMLIHPAFELYPLETKKKVLILGGGDGLALREILKYDNQISEVTLVDLDPEMTKLAKNNPYFVKQNKNSLNNSKLKILKSNSLFENNEERKIFIPSRNKLNQKDQKGQFIKVSIVNFDAYQFIDEISGLYDIIVADFPDPNSVELSKLYTKGFYEKINKKLSKYGIFVQQSTSPFDAKETFLCIGRTMKSAELSVIPYHQNVPSFGDWGWWIGGKNTTYTDSVLYKKLKNINSLKLDSTNFVTPDIIKSSLAFGKKSLTTTKTDINTITSDAVFNYYDAAWKKSGQ